MHMHKMGQDLLVARRPFRVGDCRLDLSLNEVHRSGATFRLLPKSAAALEVLVHHAGRVVSKDQLIAEIWGEDAPKEDAITQLVLDLRRAFGDSARNSRYIRTVPRVGYALVADVGPLGVDDDAGGSERVGHDTPVVENTWDTRGGGVRSRATWVALSTALVAALLVLWFRREETSPELPLNGDADRVPAAHQALVPRMITAELGRQAFPRLSPDGASIVYSVDNPETGRRELVLRSLGTGTPVSLRKSESVDYSYGVWSPDGARIAYRACDGAVCVIEVIPASGGLATRLGSTVPGPVHAFDWTADGTGLLLPGIPGSENPLGYVQVLDLATGEVRSIDDDRSETQVSLEPRMSADGRFLAFRQGYLPFSSLALVDLDSGSMRTLPIPTGNIHGFTWTPDSRHLIFPSSHELQAGLYLYSLDAAEVSRLAIERIRIPSASLRAHWLAFEVVRTRSNLAAISLLNPGDPASMLTTESTANDYMGAVGRHSGRLAFISDRTGRAQVWVRDPASGEIAPVTRFTAGSLNELSWAPDESGLMVLVQSPDGTRLFEIEADTWIARPMLPERVPAVSIVYGADRDSAHALIHEDGKSLLWNLRRTHDGWQMERTGIPGHRLRRDDVTDQSYLLASARGPINRIGAEGLVELTYRLEGAQVEFAVHNGEIYALVASESRRRELVKLDPGGGALTLGTIPFQVARDFRPAVTADGRLVVSRIFADDSDIGLLSLREVLERSDVD
jgi:DNA-binding winged helix-turn-helix (wHTH) protein